MTFGVATGLPEGLSRGDWFPDGTSVEADGDSAGGRRGEVTTSFARETGEIRRLRRLESGDDGPNMIATNLGQKQQRT